MRRFLPQITASLTVFSLLLGTSIVSAKTTSPKEPDAVFSFSINGSTITAQLQDHVKGKQLKYIVIDTGLPLVNGQMSGANDFVQYDAAGGGILFLVENLNEYDGTADRLDLGYCAAIHRYDLKTKTTRIVYSSDECQAFVWAVHPSKQMLYILEQGYEKKPKVMQIDFEKHAKSKTLATLPKGYGYDEMMFFPDSSTLRMQAENLSAAAAGQDVVVSVNLKTGKASISPPIHVESTSGWWTSLGTGNFSPDGKKVAFHFGVMEIPKGERKTFELPQDHILDNFYTMWSGDGKQVAYMIRHQFEDATTRLLTYDVRSGNIRQHANVKDPFVRQWAPSTRYILYVGQDGVNAYDTKTGKSRLVFSNVGLDSYNTETAWVYLP